MEPSGLLALRAAITAYETMNGKTDDLIIAKALVAPSVETTASSMAQPEEVITRFTPDEWLAAKKLSPTDANISWWFDRLMIRRDPIDTTGVTFIQGVDYLLDLGVLTKERATEIKSSPAGPMVSQAEQIGCGEMLRMDDRSLAVTIKYARTFGENP